MFPYGWRTNMITIFSEEILIALAGAFGGILLGLAARLGRFCTLGAIEDHLYSSCLLYTSPSPRDLSTSRMPSSA